MMRAMADTSALIEAIKRELRTREKTYAELADALEMSESSVKRMFSQKDMPLTRIDEICGFLGIDFATLAREVVNDTPLTSELTYEQEAALVKDPMLLLVAICVLSQWSFDQITQTYAVSDAQCTAKLLGLDKLGVIDLKPLNRYSLKVARTFRWRSDGPIRQFFLTHITGEYFGGRFDRPGENLLMVHGNINPAAAAVLAERMTRLGQDFASQHKADQKLDEEFRDGFTMILGLRRWEFSAFTGMRRRPAERAAMAAEGK
jgi:DNA-binding Xre family transcriptional regulator